VSEPEDQGAEGEEDGRAGDVEGADAPEAAGGIDPGGGSRPQKGSGAGESAEESQAPGESGAPPVPGPETAPGDEQASEEVTESEEGLESAGPEEEAGSGGADRGGPVAVPDDLRSEIEGLIALYPQKRSASLPALHAIQRRYGYCTPEGIEQAASVMGVEPAYLESVASFYDLFHLEPAGDHRVLVCTNISCWMRGADDLLASFCEATGADAEAAAHGGTTSADGDIYVSGFECLGACDLAPMASIDERYYGPLEDADAATVVEQLRSGAEVVPEKAMAKRAAAGGPEPEPDPRVAEVEQRS
jgi:NADH:ubiquinone oxidoreductase subunit E